MITTICMRRASLLFKAGRELGSEPANRARRGILREEGASVVEMAIACSLLFAMMFGVIEMSMALYTYHFASGAAREASRWAMVRGGNCTTNVSKSYCSPTSNNTDGADNADIQAYVRSLGYPFASNLTTATTWLSGSPGSWTACGSKCNTPPNAVQVRVSYNVPIAIPFWTATTIPISSTSSVVIAQ